MTTKVQQDYGIQPNQKGNKESFVDFMQKTTWFSAMTKALQKHSEFMRPELADGYPGMEYAYPDIHGLKPLGDPDKKEDVGNALCPGCSFGAMKFNGPLGSKDSQICFPYSGVICMTPEYDAMYAEWQSTGILPPEFGGQWPTLAAIAAAWAGGTFTWKQIKGTPVGIELVPAKERFYTGGYCIRAVGGLWPTDANITIKIDFKDVYGNTCSDTETIRTAGCCDDPATPAFTFDDASTADVVAPGGQITVYVTGGCPPFTWSVNDLGFSFAQVQTNTRANALSLDAGTCGVNYSAYGTVTITDDCGSTATAAIRSTGGKWTVLAAMDVGILQDGNPCHGLATGYSGSCTYGKACNAWGSDIEIIQGKYKWLNSGLFRDCGRNQGTFTWCDGGTGDPEITEYLPPGYEVPGASLWQYQAGCGVEPIDCACWKPHFALYQWTC